MHEVKNRVLLTGASGFFGSHLLRHLLMNTDWDILCVVSWKHKGTPERIENAWKDLDKSRVTIIRHDLEARFTEHTIRRIGKIDYILNIASNSHVDTSITNPEEFAEGNFQLILTMLKLAREIKPKLFLQFSTDEVYGPAPKGVNFKEGERQKPSNPYSGSKAAQENMAFSYWRTFGVPVIITNTMNLIGQTQDPEKFPALCLRKIYRGEEVTIHGRPDDIGSRFYIHARNAADAVLYIIKNLPPAHYIEDVVHEPSQYNIVGETELNNLELAQMTARLLGKELKYKFEDFHLTRPGHDRRYALSGEKLKKLGWQPPEGFEESWKRSIEWTLEHKDEWL